MVDFLVLLMLQNSCQLVMAMCAHACAGWLACRLAGSASAGCTAHSEQSRAVQHASMVKQDAAFFPAVHAKTWLPLWRLLLHTSKTCGPCIQRHSSAAVIQWLEGAWGTYAIFPHPVTEHRTCDAAVQLQTVSALLEKWQAHCRGLRLWNCSLRRSCCWRREDSS